MTLIELGLQAFWVTAAIASALASVWSIYFFCWRLVISFSDFISNYKCENRKLEMQLDSEKFERKRAQRWADTNAKLLQKTMERVKELEADIERHMSRCVQFYRNTEEGKP